MDVASRWCYADVVALILSARDGVGRADEARSISGAAVDRVEGELVTPRCESSCRATQMLYAGVLFHATTNGP